MQVAYTPVHEPQFSARKLIAVSAVTLLGVIALAVTLSTADHPSLGHHVGTALFSIDGNLTNETNATSATNVVGNSTKSKGKGASKGKGSRTTEMFAFGNLTNKTTVPVVTSKSKGKGASKGKGSKKTEMFASATEMPAFSNFENTLRNSRIDDMNSDLAEAMKIAVSTNNEDLNDYMDECQAIVAQILIKNSAALPTRKFEIKLRNSMIDDLNSDLAESMKIAKSTQNEDLSDYMDECQAISAIVLVKQSLPK